MGLRVKGVEFMQMNGLLEGSFLFGGYVIYEPLNYPVIGEEVKK